MNCTTLPPNQAPGLLFMALVAGTVAFQPAAARPPSIPEPVSDAELAEVSGRYYGANMLVGLRVELVSNLHTPQGTAQAAGTLDIRTNGNGFEVMLNTDSAANSNGGAQPASPYDHQAIGAEAVQVDGIGQIAQIAGDDNGMSNLTTISFAPIAAPDPSQFNQQAASQSASGMMTAHVSFDPQLGASLTVGGPGANLSQQFVPAGSDAGRVMQVGQIAGNGLLGSNRMHLQVMTGALPVQALHQMGVQQALSGLAPLGR